MPKNIICIACSIFKKEMAEIQKEKKWEIHSEFLTSMLHMNPEKLNIELEAKIKEHEDKGKKIILLYGDCCSEMATFEKNKNVFRIKGVNCIEILLGKEKYREMRKNKVFAFLPEWTLRWEEVFKNELGLTKDTAKTFIKELINKLVYLDTGVMEVPKKILKDIEKYSGLPVSIVKTEKNSIIKNLNEVLSSFEKETLNDKP